MYSASAGLCVTEAEFNASQDNLGQFTANHLTDTDKQLTVQENTQTKYNSGKQTTQNTTKQLNRYCSFLIRHSAKKRDGLTL